MRTEIPALVSCLTLLSMPAFLVAAPEVPEVVATCTECHGSDGMGHGKPMIPVIAGMPAGHIEEAIYAYVDGARRCLHEARMCETVAVLSESQVVEIANYYAAQQRGPSREEFDEGLAVQGEILHQKHCAICHRSPDDPDVEFSLGIPLNGQRREYLRYAIEAYFEGDREALLEAMALEIRGLRAGDLGALVNYYSSYRSGPD